MRQGMQIKGYDNVIIQLKEPWYLVTNQHQCRYLRLPTRILLIQ